MSTTDGSIEPESPWTPLPRWAGYVLLAVWAAPLAPALLRRYAMEHDSVNFALAASEYSLATHQPHPAGFPYWVLLIRMLGWCGIDPLPAQTLLALAFTAAAALLWIKLGGGLGRAGVFLLLLSPVAWFYAAVPSTYSVDLAFSCLALLLAVKAWDGDRGQALWLAAAIGVWSGFRSAPAVFMLPLLAGCAWRTKALVRAGGVFGALWLAWSVPVVWSAGGFAAFNKIMNDMTAPTFALSSVLYGAPLASHINALISVAIYNCLMLGPAVVAVMLSPRRQPRLALVNGQQGLLLALFAGPAALFLALIHGSKPGYSLMLLAPVLAAMLARVRLTRPAVAASAIASVALSFFPYEAVMSPENGFNFTRASLRSLFLIEDAHRAIAGLPPQGLIGIRTTRSEAPNMRSLTYHFPAAHWTTRSSACAVIANPWERIAGARQVCSNAVYSLWLRDCAGPARPAAPTGPAPVTPNP